MCFKESVAGVKNSDEESNNSILNNVEGGNWKSMAITVLCATPGNQVIKANRVVNSLISAYPSTDWVVYVGRDSVKSWAYSVRYWDLLDKRNICGGYDLVVVGRKRKYCRKSTDKAAHLLQQGALADAGSDPIKARDLMMRRQGTYDLSYDFIMVHPNSGGSSWYRIGYLQCFDFQHRNGLISIWSGSATD